MEGQPAQAKLEDGLIVESSPKVREIPKVRETSKIENVISYLVYRAIHMSRLCHGVLVLAYWYW